MRKLFNQNNQNFVVGEIVRLNPSVQKPAELEYNTNYTVTNIGGSILDIGDGEYYPKNLFFTHEELHYDFLLNNFERPLLTGVNFKGRTYPIGEVEFITFNNVTFNIENPHRPLHVPTKEVKFLYNTRYLKKGDTFIATPQSIIGYYGDDRLFDSTHPIIFGGIIGTPNNIYFNQLLVNNGIIEIVYEGCDLDGYFQLVVKNSEGQKVRVQTILNLVQYSDLVKFGKVITPIKVNNNVFVKSLQLTGVVREVIITSGVIYYHVLLDSNKTITTRVKNLKLIK